MTKLNTPLRFELIDNSKAQMANASAKNSVTLAGRRRRCFIGY